MKNNMHHYTTIWQVYGEGGEERELIAGNPRVGVHQFIEDEDDAPEPEAYEGEDTAQIDADDDETNFGAEAEEGEAEESPQEFGNEEAE